MHPHMYGDAFAGAAATVADQVVSSVIPNSIRATVRRTARGLPANTLPPLPRDGSMLYRIAALDHRGRLAEQAIVHALGWEPDELLIIDVHASTIVCYREQQGNARLTKRAHIPIPTPLRRWYGLVAGDRMLLGAVPESEILIIHTMTALDQMVLAHHKWLTETQEQL